MKKHARFGKTLIELMATLAIILILGTMAVAGYGWVKPWVMQKLGWIVQAGDPVDMIPNK